MRRMIQKLNEEVIGLQRVHRPSDRKSRCPHECSVKLLERYQCSPSRWVSARALRGFLVTY